MGFAVMRSPPDHGHRGYILSSFFLSHFRLTRLAVLLLVAALGSCQSVDVANFAPLSEKYSAMVIKEASGKVIHETNSDTVRYPASLTKMMTLYLLFEAIDSGRIPRDGSIPVSAYAASRPPSKLGVKAGESVPVDIAIKALAVKSANDIAAAVGEAVSGSEAAFASMMTAKARAIGMARTQFVNASGLPDSNQYSTARDMALLGLALRKRYPHYFSYFSLRSFDYNGRTIRGHNHLLGDPGVDGIKTGYIRASGFNIVVSVSKYGKRFIVVVMGGDNAKERDTRVRQLIAAHAR